MGYGIGTGAGRISSDEIIAQLEANGSPIALAYAESVRDLERNGMRYSNQDCDVLGPAWRAIERTEFAAYEAGYVAYQLKARAERLAAAPRNAVTFRQCKTIDWVDDTQGRLF